MARSWTHFETWIQKRWVKESVVSVQLMVAQLAWFFPDLLSTQRINWMKRTMLSAVQLASIVCIETCHHLQVFFLAFFT